MFTIPGSHHDLLLERTHHFAKLWKIERTDGTTLRFTDHDHQLIDVNRTPYTPLPGMSGTAFRTEVSLEAGSSEVVGIFESTTITQDDLAEGRYRNAKITEFLVDWRAPFVGQFLYSIYWVEETEFTGESWIARVANMPVFLKNKVGGRYNIDCRYELFDSKCSLLRTNFQDFTTSQGDAADRYSVVIDVGTGPGQADDKSDPEYWTGGEAIFTSGALTGITMPILKYDQAGATLKFAMRTPADILDGDALTVYPGCDFKSATCKARFNNFVNYGGFEFIPGVDRLMRTPAS